ncbi:MAG: hypothetical protein R2911_42215 [Caldilineaceae bacterium]
MPAAEQMAHLVDFFASIRWWELRPALELLAAQPGDEDVHKFVLASARRLAIWRWFMRRKVERLCSMRRC